MTAGDAGIIERALAPHYQRIMRLMVAFVFVWSGSLVGGAIAVTTWVTTISLRLEQQEEALLRVQDALETQDERIIALLRAGRP